MAFGVGTVWEVETTGSVNNGAGFDTNSASFATDLAATSATGTAPVLTSASYTFIARDVGHWVFIKAGTNWRTGWFLISSVSAGAATVDATADNWIDGTTNSPGTTTGIATVASPTGGTWSVDYSQSTAIAFTDLVLVTTTTMTSAAHPMGKNFVGNIFNTISGTGWTVQRIQITSVTGTTATIDKVGGTISSTGGTGNLGGPHSDFALVCAIPPLSGNRAFIKSGTYSITSNLTNVAGGTPSLWTSSTQSGAAIIGYGTLRGDNGTMPLFQASGISTFILFTGTTGNHIENIAFDGAGLTSGKGILCGNNALHIYRCKFSNFTNNGVSSTNGGSWCVLCEFTGCSAAPAVNCGCISCSIHDNSNVGGLQGSVGQDFIDCVIANNTSASHVEDGIQNNNTGAAIIGCTIYGCGRDGIRKTAGTAMLLVQNTIVYTTPNGSSFNSSAADGNTYLVNCAADSAPNANLTTWNSEGFILLTADPFTAKGSNDFSLNTTAGGGAALRAAGIAGTSSLLKLPGLSTNNYIDVGAVQHADPAGGTGVKSRRGILTGGAL